MPVRTVAVLAFVLPGFCADRALAQEQKPAPKLPQGIDADTVRAWEKRGFRVGWLGMWEESRAYVVGLRFRADPTGLRDPVPAFQVSKIEAADDLSGLPSVGVPFGLDLADSTVTDAGLKHLAALTNLTT